jgi:hypothetical protein
MADHAELEAALRAIAAGTATAGQQALAAAGVRDGRIVVTGANRLAAVGGNVDGSSVVVGDRNIVLTVAPDRLREALGLAPAPPAPRLRDAPDHFVGRADEAADLAAALTGGGRCAHRRGRSGRSGNPAARLAAAAAEGDGRGRAAGVAALRPPYAGRRCRVRGGAPSSAPAAAEVRLRTGRGG